MDLPVRVFMRICEITDPLQSRALVVVVVCCSRKGWDSCSVR